MPCPLYRASGLLLGFSLLGSSVWHRNLACSGCLLFLLGFGWLLVLARLPRLPYIAWSSGCIKAPWSVRLNLASFSVMAASFIWSCIVHSSLTWTPSISQVLHMVVTFPELNLPLIPRTCLAWLHCFSLWHKFFSSDDFLASFSSANAFAKDSWCFFWCFLNFSQVGHVGHLPV